jgi:hypothetical protein
VGTHNLGMGMGVIPNSFPMLLTWSLTRMVATSRLGLGEQGFAHDPTTLSTVIFTCSF